MNGQAPNQGQYGDLGAPPPNEEPIPGPAMGVHGSSPADIVEFLEHATAKGPIDCISLYQEMFDGTKEKIRDIAVKAIDPIALAENLSRIVVSRAELRGKRTSFIVEAWSGSNLRGSHLIVRDVQLANKSSVVNEPPTEAGVAAQLMRHLEVRERQSFHVIDANFGHLARANRELSRENEQLRRERLEVANLMRQNIIQSVDTEYLREQNRLKVHATAQLFGALIQMLPTIIQKFSANEVVERFRVFASGLGPEQQLAIGAALTPEQGKQLGELFKTLEPPKLPGAVQKALGTGQQAAQAPQENQDKAPASQ
jgi:hypothetical protein